jgi:hypothetical protein
VKKGWQDEQISTFTISFVERVGIDVPHAHWMFVS